MGATTDATNHNWSQNFAVHGIFWRKGLDWAILNVPFYFHPFLIFVWTLIFFTLARPARRALVSNLALVRPGAAPLANYLHAFRVFQNFAWTLTEATVYKFLKPEFRYELVGQNFLTQLAAAPGAIVLTAHMGNYDLGAAIFAEKFHRDLRMVRAPEPDQATAQHLDLSIEQAGAGAVKVDYNTAGNLLSFDLLNALRAGEIISIQGDRVMGDVSQSPVTLFGEQVFLPSGPFVLALVAGVPIHPLFIARTGYRRYKIIAREPIIASRNERSRDEEIARVMQRWGQVLELTIGAYSKQWFAFTAIAKS